MDDNDTWVIDAILAMFATLAIVALAWYEAAREMGVWN